MFTTLMLMVLGKVHDVYHLYYDTKFVLVHCALELDSWAKNFMHAMCKVIVEYNTSVFNFGFHLCY